MSWRFPIVMASLVSVASAGCSVQTMAVRETAGIMERGMGAMYREPDVDLAAQALPSSLKLVEVFLESDPGNPAMLLILAQGYASYAYTVVEDHAEVLDMADRVAEAKAERVRAAKFYQRAQGYALRLLGDGPLAEALGSGQRDRIVSALEGATKDDVPALFWFTFSWAARINLDQSNPERIAELPITEALLARLLELDPEYFHGLPLLTAGVSYSARAPMFGGDPAKGKALLERGMGVSGGRFLLGRFLMARYYAVQVQDLGLFCKSLQEVLDAPEDVLPEQTLMNQVVKRWAARWLGRVQDTFEGAPESGCAPQGGQEDTEEDDDGML